VSELFGPGIIVAAVTPLPDGVPLHPTEENAVRRAVPQRRREFAAGRLCARRALAQLGLIDVVIPAGPDREPLWPEGIAGSITHTDAACVVVTARRNEVRSVGVDAEPDEPLPHDLDELTCTPAERRRLAAYPHSARRRLARLIFSAKECFYKLQYPLTHRFLDFQDAQVDPDTASGRFNVALLRDAGDGFPAGSVFAGRYTCESGLIVTAMVRRASSYSQPSSIDQNLLSRWREQRLP
jgi:4'-phosphopantetheinyl transferase EntD